MLLWLRRVLLLVGFGKLRRDQADIGGRNIRFIGIERFVHDCKQTPGVKRIVRNAVDRHALACGGVAEQRVEIALQKLLRIVKHVADGQIGRHVGGKNLSKFLQLCQIADLHALLGERLEKILLHLCALDILRRVALAVAHKPHRLFAVEQLIALLEVNIKVLAGIGIIHVLRYVEPHAADQLDRFLKRLEIDEHVAVHRKAQHGCEPRFQPIHARLLAAGIDGIDFHNAAVGARHDGVSRNAQKRGHVRIHIQMRNDDGIGTVAVAVGPANEDVVHTLAIAGRDFHFNFRFLAREIVRLLLHLDDRGFFDGLGRRDDHGLLRLLIPFDRPHDGLIDAEHHRGQNAHGQRQQQQPLLHAGKPPARRG